MADEDEDDVKAISALIAALKPLNAESRVHVLEFVLKKLGISLSAQHASPAHIPAAAHTPATPPPATPHHPPPSGVHDIGSFAAAKKPKTVNEKVAVIGYYLAQLAPEGERRDYLIADDIKTYFIQADLQLPTAQPSVTLINAKNAGYFNVSDRGQYKLNAVGHNLVAHKLPSSEPGEAKRRTAPRKPTKKATTRKKAGK
ncbi:MAG: hypothetical protein ABSG18_24010 [Steroidobacteraceae bacterium]|jgi:hypothetical protein